MQRSKEFNDVVDILKRIIREQGKEILNKPKIVIGYLLDYYKVKDKNLLREIEAALENKIAVSLLHSSSQDILQTKKRLVLQLQNAYPYLLKEEEAIEAVNLICSVLDIPEIETEKTNQTDAVSQPGSGGIHQYSNRAQQVHTGSSRAEQVHTGNIDPAKQKAQKNSHDDTAQAKRDAIAYNLSREWDAISTINSDREFLKNKGSTIKMFIQYRLSSVLSDIGFLLLLIVMIVLLIRIIIMFFAGSIWGCLWRIAIIIICGRAAFSLYPCFRRDRHVFLLNRHTRAEKLDEIDRLNHDFPENSRLMPVEYQDERHYKTAIDLLHHGAVDAMPDIVAWFKSM